MKLLEIIEMIKSGDLVLEKHENGKKFIDYPIYSKTKGEWLEYPNFSKKENKIILIKK
jgi:hypothetical protein